MGLIDEKTEGRKSRDTVPLTNPPLPPSPTPKTFNTVVIILKSLRKKLSEARFRFIRFGDLLHQLTNCTTEHIERCHTIENTTRTRTVYLHHIHTVPSNYIA
jgi:hypothetical protein